MNFALRRGPPGPPGVGIPGPQGPQGLQGDPGLLGTVTDGTTINLTLTGDDLTAEVIQAALDHGSVGGLADDDHTQYALLVGRAGGQELIGATAAAADGLTLKPTTDASASDVVFDLTGHRQHGVRADLAASLTGAQTAFNVAPVGTLAMGAGAGVRALSLTGTFDISGDPAGVSFLVFNMNATINLRSPATTDLNAFSVYRATPVFNLKDGNAYGAIGGTEAAFLHAAPSFTRDATETATYGDLSLALWSPSIGAGWTIPTLRGVHFNPSGSGTVTDLIAVDVKDPSLTSLTLTNPARSLRSRGSAVELAHAGPGVFGADAAPSNASVGLEVQSTTRALLVPRMTTAQKNALTALKGMIVYDTTLDTFEGFQGAGAGAWAAL